MSPDTAATPSPTFFASRPKPPVDPKRHTPAPTVIELPSGTPSSVFFIDESGSKGSGGNFFVVGGVKSRGTGHLLRRVKSVRDEHRYFNEFKFSELTHGTVPIYRDLIRVIASSDCHLVAYVIDKRIRDPFVGVQQWDAHAQVLVQLLHGSINRAEVATLLMDHCSSPTGVAIDEVVLTRVNERIGSMNLVSAVSLDSKSTDGLQVADLVASAIAFDRHRNGSSGSPKSIVSAELAAAFGLRGFDDVRLPRVNILTNRPRSRVAKNLKKS